MAAKNEIALENDGEVAVCLPFLGYSFDYRRAYTQRRLDVTEEIFRREQCPVMKDAAEVKARLLEVLGITEREMHEAMQKARSASGKCQNLRRLVQSSRKSRAHRRS